MTTNTDTPPGTPPTPTDLPDRWWENLDFVVPYVIPDSIGLAGEPADTPRARVTDVLIAEVCEIYRKNSSLPYAVPPLGSPHYGKTIQRVVDMYNARPDCPKFRVLDADQGRVNVGAAPWGATIRLLVVLAGDPSPSDITLIPLPPSTADERVPPPSALEQRAVMFPGLNDAPAFDGAAYDARALARDLEVLGADWVPSQPS